MTLESMMFLDGVAWVVTGSTQDFFKLHRLGVNARLYKKSGSLVFNDVVTGKWRSRKIKSWTRH